MADAGLTTATAVLAQSREINMAHRTDIHREGALVPSDYVCVLNYSLPSTWEGAPVPAIGLNCATERGCKCVSNNCCLYALRTSGVTFAQHGSDAQCTACGAHFIHGAVWKHTPTGEHIFLGHICSDNASLVSDYSSHRAALDAARRLALVEGKKKIKENKVAEFISQHDGLKEALETPHHIVRDIAAKLKRYGSISQRQIDFALKLAGEHNNPQPSEKHCDAPTGRHTFRGKVVGIKTYDSMYGIQQKMTVKVERPDGATWLAWGTVPSGVYSNQPLRGATVEIRATLEKGREPHFALMKRPCGKIVAEAEN